VKINRLLLAVLLVAGAYAGFVFVFTYLLSEPIPASVIKMYMFFIIVGVVLALTADDESVREMVEPFTALVFNKKYLLLRNIVFITLPIIGMAITYWITKPTMDAPVELRTVHPAPPSSLKAFGKTFNLQTLKNPFRETENTDPDKFAAYVTEGRDVYYKNCFYCHGDKLAGKGHYAIGFNNPLPANFVDVGTIAQLQESFLFWRIATGGPGLPNEGAPWASPMPVWQNYLSENEIWKVIMFLYDYTGHAPRVMDDHK